MALDELLRSRLRDVRLFATDFDGVHTDGRVTVTRGEATIEGRAIVIRSESVTASRKDGLAYDMLRAAGIFACIISKEAHPVVAELAEKLRVPYYQRQSTAEEKRDILRRVTAEQRLERQNVLYMGDDLNDAEVLAWAIVPVCPADAHAHIRRLVGSRHGIVTTTRGGEGCIREVVEMLLVAKGLPLAF